MVNRIYSNITNTGLAPVFLHHFCRLPPYPLFVAFYQTQSTDQMDNPPYGALPAVTNFESSKYPMQNRESPLKAPPRQSQALLCSVLAAGLCLMPFIAQADAPSPEAIQEYQEAMKASAEAQQLAPQLQALAQPDIPVTAENKAAALATADQLVGATQRMRAHLDKAAALNHAAAMYGKAKIEAALSPIKGRVRACELYEKSAELGLTAGAVEYSKCNSGILEQYSQQMALLQATLEGNDPYAADYPLPTAFSSCFPRSTVASKPEQDAYERILENGVPQGLDLDDFRADGYYRLATDITQPKDVSIKQFKLAFKLGCRDDPQNMAKYLKLPPPSLSPE